jgi:hypothetical protein
MNIGPVLPLRRHYPDWGQSVREARRRWPKLTLWAFVRAAELEADGEPTPAVAGRLASAIVLEMAEFRRFREETG